MLNAEKTQHLNYYGWTCGVRSADLISNEASFQSILLIYSGLYQWEVFLEYWNHITVSELLLQQLKPMEQKTGNLSPKLSTPVWWQLSDNLRDKPAWTLVAIKTNTHWLVTPKTPLKKIKRLKTKFLEFFLLHTDPRIIHCYHCHAHMVIAANRPGSDLVNSLWFWTWEHCATIQRLEIDDSYLVLKSPPQRHTVCELKQDKNFATILKSS